MVEMRMQPRAAVYVLALVTASDSRDVGECRRFAASSGGVIGSALRKSDLSERQCTPLSDKAVQMALADRRMRFDHVYSVGASARTSTIHTEQPSAMIDKLNTITPRNNQEMPATIDDEELTDHWSVERSARMSRERTCPEHGRCGGSDREFRLRAGGGEPIDK